MTVRQTWFGLKVSLEVVEIFDMRGKVDMATD